MSGEKLTRSERGRPLFMDTIVKRKVGYDFDDHFGKMIDISWEGM